VEARGKRTNIRSRKLVSPKKNEVGKKTSDGPSGGASILAARRGAFAVGASGAGEADEGRGGAAQDAVRPRRTRQAARAAGATRETSCGAPCDDATPPPLYFLKERLDRARGDDEH
jgi:hypothetical protein